MIFFSLGIPPGLGNQLIGKFGLVTWSGVCLGTLLTFLFDFFSLGMPPSLGNRLIGKFGLVTWSCVCFGTLLTFLFDFFSSLGIVPGLGN